MAWKSVILLEPEMSCEQELSRMREVNLQLRRKLESARREVLLFAASVCEENTAGISPREGWVLSPLLDPDDMKKHAGSAYAKKLREIAGE
jgi:hypothetical protein